MRFTKKLLIALVAAVLLSSIVVATARYEVRSNANRIIHSSYELFQQGQRPSIEDARKQFGNKLKQTSPCTDLGCGFEVVTSNHLLARFHLAQLATLRSTFWARNGILDENVIEFWTLRKDDRMVLAYTDAKYCKVCNDFSSGNSISIDLDSDALRKRNAFRFNTNCFLIVKGCMTPSDLLPAVKHD